jgi:ABC-type oligopeptide transport system ATPase subunit
MNRGKLVELNTTARIFEDPSEDYTKQLLSAIPLADPIKERKRQRAVSNKRNN